MRGKPQIVIVGCASSAIVSFGGIAAGGPPMDCTHLYSPTRCPTKVGAAGRANPASEPTLRRCTDINFSS